MSFYNERNQATGRNQTTGKVWEGRKKTKTWIYTFLMQAFKETPRLREISNHTLKLNIQSIPDIYSTYKKSVYISCG